MTTTNVLPQPRNQPPVAVTVDASAEISVRISLQDYEGAEGSPSSRDVEARYRKWLERAFGGPQALALALRAYTQACEGEPDEMDGEQRSLAEAWVAASQRAHAESLGGLEAGQSAWFEVSAVEADPMAGAPAARLAPVEVVEVVVFEAPIPMDEVFTVAATLGRPVAPPRAVAACDQPSARTRARSSVKAVEAVAQISLFQD